MVTWTLLWVSLGISWVGAWLGRPGGGRGPTGPGGATLGLGRRPPPLGVPLRRLSPAAALAALACGAPPYAKLPAGADDTAAAPPTLDAGRSWRLDAATLGLDTTTPVGFGGPGVAVGDLDGDGVAELAWVSPRGWGLVLAADGAGGYVPTAELVGGNGVSMADPDGDGDLDLLVLGLGTDTLYTNDGAGGLTPAPLDENDDRLSHSASWADLDGDGDLDLFLARYLRDLNGALVLERGARGEGNEVLRNNGEGRLVPDRELLDDAARMGLSFHGAWLDGDGDGDLDLFIVNDFGPTVVGHRYLRNDGGTLVDATAGCGCGLEMFGMGVAVGDPDGDGDPDLFVTNLGPPRFLENDGTGAFFEASAATGIAVPDDERHDASWAAAFFDPDLDGREDLAVTFGQLNAPGTQMAEWLEDNAGIDFENAAAQPDVLLHNRGAAGWTDAAAAAGFDETGVVRTLATGDLDGDPQPEVVRGGLDFLLVWDPAPTENNGLVFTLDAGDQNRFGLGARVEATVAGTVHTRWMQPTSQGSFSASAPELVVGLGPATAAERLRVVWPDGSETVHEGLAAGRHHLVR